MNKTLLKKLSKYSPNDYSDFRDIAQKYVCVVHKVWHQNSSDTHGRITIFLRAPTGTGIFGRINKLEDKLQTSGKSIRVLTWEDVDGYYTLLELLR